MTLQTVQKNASADATTRRNGKMAEETTNDEFWKELGMPAGMLASVDQFDMTVKQNIEAAVTALTIAEDAGMVTPPSYMAVVLAKELGLNPTDVEDPLVKMTYMYIYALYALKKEWHE
jgi:hypothetical protein